MRRTRRTWVRRLPAGVLYRDVSRERRTPVIRPVGPSSTVATDRPLRMAASVAVPPATLIDATIEWSGDEMLLAACAGAASVSAASSATASPPRRTRAG